ncbi:MULTISPECIES: cytoplasmic protein [Bacillus cereus group]|uniref:Cytoplasmic protein n=1 Tax=Bacillus cereus TaxID=1396 RepID=A0A2A8U7P7_BACCE|nr:cytoplasmic protein [Bacillus cereus]PDY81019.1 cytoplasmic protein [Bacillus cereus]PFA15331.1 cytoplasmic protein [Bacillus cereus]PFM43058.1 cytoplasmic protein [Bacillus cereus]PGL65417.1 cytoplasmic protein [Bacillus cereus]PGQ11194.1 cytoplasmic protein [Bacillus cereus]
MDKQQYDTIKLHINQEKEQILKEVYELTAEKRKIEQKKEYDLHVVKSRSKVVQTGQRIMVGMLSSHTFSPERIEEWNRKIKKTEGFIQKNESLLEKIKEKERVIDEMYQEDCKKLAKVKEELEEKMLLDLKMSMNG